MNQKKDKSEDGKGFATGVCVRERESVCVCFTKEHISMHILPRFSLLIDSYLYFYTTLEYVYMSMIISSCSPRYASARLFLLGIMWDGVDEDYCSNHSMSVYVRNTRPKEHALT